MNIILGSTSPHKLTAVELACAELKLHATITGVKAPSGQHEQPVGYEATYAGALNRAHFARAQSPDSLAIGIESGIFRFCGVTLDIAIVVLLHDADMIITTSQGIQYPENCVEIAEERGFETTTVASVIAERLGGDATDPHTTLSKGTLTRTMTLIDALTTALQQL